MGQDEIIKIFIENPDTWFTSGELKRITGKGKGVVGKLVHRMYKGGDLECR